MEQRTRIFAEEEMEDEQEDSPHILQFLDSELNSTYNNNRYDNLVAGGSNEERKRQWIIYSSMTLVVAAFVLIVLISILVNRGVRRKSFNLFLVFLMVPDFVFSFLCGINCALNAAHGDYISVQWCRFQAFYVVWGIGTDAWLNGAIARHIHEMLLCSHKRKRYFPPIQRRVIMESLIIYVWLAFVASWTLIDYLPHQARLSAGIACLPHEYDTASTIFQWVAFVPLFVLIPTTYVLYVAFDVIRKKLLPPQGRKRNLAIYFFRLVVVFLVMWVPTIFLIFVAGGHLPSWVSFLGGFWSHLQGAVSAGATIMKEDIGNAFLDFITCKCSHGEDVSAAMTRPSLLSLESFGIPRVHGRRRSSSSRPPSPKNDDNVRDDVDEKPCRDDVGVAGSVNDAAQTEMAKYSTTSAMEHGQIQDRQGDDDIILDKALPPKDPT